MVYMGVFSRGSIEGIRQTVEGPCQPAAAEATLSHYDE
jgi:hypothetical protein